MGRNAPLYSDAQRDAHVAAVLEAGRRSPASRGMDAPTAKDLARAGFEHDFYLASKHYGVWYMKTQLGLSNADIAAQA
jgi:hypothetical protein